jgi:hypothetical protein
MSKRLVTIAVVVAALSGAPALLATPANGHATPPNCGIPGCVVSLTTTGPSPATLTMNALQGVAFFSGDSASHTAVFANGLCSLTVTPDQGAAYCGNGDFLAFAGTYAYMVDGKFAGTVIVKPLQRSVTLTARTHIVRRGARLTLHGHVMWKHGDADLLYKPFFPVVVLARHSSGQPFRRIATVQATFGRGVDWNGWRLTVRPGQTTTYIAVLSGQLARLGRGQIWINARSRPFTVRVPR